MQTVWEIDVVDLKKQMIKVHQRQLSLSKKIFVPGLLDAKLHLNNLIAICHDCTWKIDVATGVRHRLTKKIMIGKFVDEEILEELVIPEFLKKKT